MIIVTYCHVGRHSNFKIYEQKGQTRISFFVTTPYVNIQKIEMDRPRKLVIM